MGGEQSMSIVQRAGGWREYAMISAQLGASWICVLWCVVCVAEGKGEGWHVLLRRRPTFALHLHLPEWKMKLGGTCVT